MSSLSNLEKFLFESGALKIADANKPFWYTSGMIGPFFINTHFLYGGEENAVSLLNYINDNLDDKAALVKSLYNTVNNFYNTNDMYKHVIDDLVKSCEDKVDFDNIDYISGGERRDWFFSIMFAVKTNKPHLFIFKDGTIYDNDEQVVALDGKRLLHVADLITVASSYERAWIPFIEKAGGKILSTVSVVDRNQGGKDILAKYGIETYSPIVIGGDFFDKAVSNGVISSEQKTMICDFLKDAKSYGINFLTNHVDFLKSSLSSENASTKDKSNRCINDNVYGVKFF